jgi:hypothetical protein
MCCSAQQVVLVIMFAVELAHHQLQSFIAFSFSKVPVPVSKPVELKIGPKTYRFMQDDFHVSFHGFLNTVPPELQMDRAAMETNRYLRFFYCFLFDVLFRLIGYLLLQ